MRCDDLRSGNHALSEPLAKAFGLPLDQRREQASLGKASSEKLELPR